MKKILALAAAALLTIPALADEGMWLLPLLQKMNGKALQEAGCKLTPEQIYSINNTSLKDAIIHFGGGCTGEIISGEGLIVTNHHCGYSSIQSLSTPEHNYLMDGYWAMSREGELPCRGLTVTFLKSMTDVTDILAKVEAKAAKGGDEKAVEEALRAKAQELTAEAEKANPNCTAQISSFYNGNVQYLIVSKVYRDIRFVGAPPASVGKFGGETDNWMWPRHTGDFSMFRVYAGADNEPADYSPENKPYRPANYLKISLAGTQEGDYAMIMGYPGRTQRFQTAAQLKQMLATNRIAIDARTVRQDLMWEAMCADPDVQLKYASKYASSANGWKKWQGETLGIERLDGVNQKKAQEAQFQAWADKRDEYRNVLRDLSRAYDRIRPIELEWTYFNEAVMASDLMNRAYKLYSMVRQTTNDDSLARVECDKLLAANETYFADFELHSPVDRAIFVETFLHMWRAGYAPYLDKKGKDEAGVQRMLENIYDKSMLNNKAKYDKFLKKYKAKDWMKVLSNADPALDLFNIAYTYAYTSDKETTYDLNKREINRLMRTYVRGMMQQYPDSNFFPDANLTLRVAYGHVQGFRPKDAVYYTPYSTLEGIMEKENPDIYDYVVEPKLKELYNNHDYGRYANAAGQMPVAFIATNHTTGGNSGSPVLNADGQLIGINFDRCWEGTMSDLLFDPNYCRNISLDIRYCLFIIDKFAGARHLVDEMTIVQ